MNDILLKKFITHLKTLKNFWIDTEYHRRLKVVEFKYVKKDIIYLYIFDGNVIGFPLSDIDKLYYTEKDTDSIVNKMFKLSSDNLANIYHKLNDSSIKKITYESKIINKITLSFTDNSIEFHSGNKLFKTNSLVELTEKLEITKQINITKELI